MNSHHSLIAFAGSSRSAFLPVQVQRMKLCRCETPCSMTCWRSLAWLADRDGRDQLTKEEGRAGEAANKGRLRRRLIGC
ncbi:hypothetical protein EVAR_89452_1 [Eumeta japonica]|uniref:Uncharacterized protein n=1 Tax=Eumeta variegata TaxID=151549 RepID=A0A4C1Z4I5_EUMVA|nr:hypothetical protein EVAR_89452_1 [Eumeta japonica]